MWTVHYTCVNFSDPFRQSKTFYSLIREAEKPQVQSVPSLSEKISLSAAIFSSDGINLYSSTNNARELADNAKPERSPDFSLRSLLYLSNSSSTNYVPYGNENIVVGGFKVDRCKRNASSRR